MSFIDKIAKIKLRYIYATSWFNIVGMPLLVANLLQQKLLALGININFIFILVGGIICVGIAGYVMDKIGLYESENTYAAKKNKEIQEIKNNMRENNVKEQE